MNTLKNILASVMVLSLSICNAQIQNVKIQNVKILGNCGMCEKTIETTGNSRKVAKVDWNKETKMAIISYDSIKTAKAEILKRIALAGYDSDSFLAPDDTYNALPGCCQYDRSKQPEHAMQNSSSSPQTNQAKMTMKAKKIKESPGETSIQSMSKKTIEQQIINANPLRELYDSYFNLKDALVNTDAITAFAEGKKMVAIISNVKMEDLSAEVQTVWMDVKLKLNSEAQTIAKSNDIASQRNDFINLSENMYQLIKASKVKVPIYYQHCPMANDGKGANWLSKENIVKNPYFGSMMMSCGKVVETIK